MGCNYFLGKIKCGVCGNSIQALHIGKSSIGWAFLFRSYEDGPKTYKEWVTLILNSEKIIVDQNDEYVCKEEFFFMVENKKDKKKLDIEWEYTDLDGYRFSKREFC